MYLSADMYSVLCSIDTVGKMRQATERDVSWENPDRQGDVAHEPTREQLPDGSEGDHPDERPR